MRLYGPKGELPGYLDIINACDVKDQYYCNEVCCCICAYPSGETLLTEICLTILCYENKRFDVENGNFHDVMKECCVSWIKDEMGNDWNVPF